MANKRLTTQQMQELAAQSAAKPRIAPQVSPGDIKVETSTRRLRVLDVHQYDNNPRRASDTALAEIRESIRNIGRLLSRITVCRLPDGRYVTAMGGGTRLEALHQLASETDEQGRPTADAKRFEYEQFDEVPWPGESRLLAAHLAENMNRKDMCFWDTATGIVKLRANIQTELGRNISGREFIEEMKSRGLSTVAPDNLSTYEYAVPTFQGLDTKFQKHLTRNDVRDVLRPGFGVLETFWKLHSDVGDLKSLQDSWLSLYDVPPERFGSQGLLTHLQTQAAQHLGYAPDAFLLLLAAHKRAPTATLAELSEFGTKSPETDTNNTGPATGPETETEDQRISREGLENLKRTLAGRNTLRMGLPDSVPSTSGSDGSNDDEEGGEEGGDDLNPLDPQLGQHHDPIPGGIKTASTHQLQIKQPFDASGRPTQRTTSNNTPQAPQTPLTGMDERSSALHVMHQTLMQLAVQAGLESYVTDAPEMPYGFFIDIPATGVLSNADDPATQAWWLLANLSGQFPNDIDTLLQSGALPDTGPDGYLQRVSGVETWADVVTQRLGGQTLFDAGFVVYMLTQSPFADIALELTTGIKQVNDAGGNV